MYSRKDVCFKLNVVYQVVAELDVQIVLVIFGVIPSSDFFRQGLMPYLVAWFWREAREEQKRTRVGCRCRGRRGLWEV